MEKAVAYCRFSSDNQREESIDAQVRAIKDFCSKNEYNLIHVYSDEAKSGTSDNREEFLKMIEDSGKDKFDAIIVHKLDRFSRNKYDSAIYKKKLKDNGVKLISVLERLDGSPESILMESVIEGMSQFYSANLAREVMKGMKENAYNCKHTGGIPPTGYDVLPDKTYAINEKEAEIVKKIFSMYLAGNGYALIAQELNNGGQCTKLGRLFTKNSIRDILLNEKYTGTYIFNRRLSKKDNHKYKDASEIIRIEDGMPAIISKEDFKEAQDRITNKRRGPRMNSKRFYLLTGKIECGECGAAYVGAGYVPGRGGKKYYVYSCTNKRNRTCKNKNIRQDVLEQFVIDELNNGMFAPKAIEDNTALLKEKMAVRNKSHDDRLNSLKKEKKDIEKKLEIAFDMVVEGKMSKDDYAKKSFASEPIIKDIDLEIMKLEDTDGHWITEEKIKGYILGYKEMFESDDPVLKRKAIEQFVNKIKIYPDRVDLTLMVDMLDSDSIGGGDPILTIPLSITKKQLFS